MPPTWAVLAYFRLYHGLPTVPLAIVGVLRTTTGRAFGNRLLPVSWRANIERLVEALQARPWLATPSLILFTLGPLPTNHLFVAAGIAGAPLLPIMLVFAVARTRSYVLWMGAVDVADRSLQTALGAHLGRWGVIAAQLTGFGRILPIMTVDWRRFRRAGHSNQQDATQAWRGISGFDKEFGRLWR